LQIKHKISGEILFEIDRKILINANLVDVDLCEADLRGADLQEADLRGADLQEADLRGANLKGADLRDTNLQDADLQWATLTEADLRGANLDFSVLFLHCKTFNIRVSARFIFQLIAHIKRMVCDDPEAQEALKALEPWKNEFCKYRSDVEPI
jgi:hypothetical protein